MKLKYDVDECQERGMTYAVPLKVTIRRVVWNKIWHSVKTIRDIEEQESCFGDIPLMTDNGTFIINGTGASSSAAPPLAGRLLPLGRQDALRRADHPVSRLVGGVRVRPEEPALRPHRSQAQVPGDGVPARARPARRRRDHPDLLLGRSHLAEPGASAAVGGLRQPGRAARRSERQGRRLLDPSGKKITANAIAALRKAGIETVPVADEALEGRFAAADIIDPETGEVILEANEELTPRVISMAQEKRVERIEVFFPERDDVGAIIGRR